MTPSLQDCLIERFRAVLEVHTKALPAAIPLAVPIRKLAEAAVDVLAMGRGVPMIPTWDDELAAQRTWTGVRTAAELAEGLGFPHLEILRGDGEVVFTATNTEGQVCLTRLPPNDAEEYALYVLAAVQAVRAESDMTITQTT